MRRELLIGLVCLACLIGAAQARGQGDTGSAEKEPDRGLRLIPPGGYYGDWIFLLEAYYSGLDGVGLGLEVSRPFTVPFLERYSVSGVEFQARGKLYEQFRGELELKGQAELQGGQWSLRSSFLHATRGREFWGVGPDLSADSREFFRPRDARLYFETLRRLRRLRVGVRLEGQDYQYLETTPGGLLESGAYPGVSSSGRTIFGYGLVWELDNRNERYNPSRGWWLQGFALKFEQLDGDGPNFMNYYVDLRHYRALNDRNVLAVQAFAYGVGSDAPVWRYAAVGGREHSRGFSRNRYLDRRMFAAQVEWRRPLWWRFGLQVFTGTALVADDIRKMQLKHQHPTFGVGLSLQVPEVSSVAIRGELAVGDESLHGTLAIGHAF